MWFRNNFLYIYIYLKFLQTLCSYLVCVGLNSVSTWLIYSYYAVIRRDETASWNFYMLCAFFHAFADVDNQPGIRTMKEENYRKQYRSNLRKIITFMADVKLKDCHMQLLKTTPFLWQLLNRQNGEQWRITDSERVTHFFPFFEPLIAYL